MERWISFFGIFIQIAICYGLSTNRKKIDWKLVSVGMGLQFIFAMLILKTGAGRAFFAGVNDIIVALLGFTRAGAEFVFGGLTMLNVPVGIPLEGAPPGFADLSTSEGLWARHGAFFAFGVMPTVIFFSSLMAILYHFGIMQRVVYALAVVMKKTMGVSGAESLCAAANIFVGLTEAPLVIKPYIKNMTDSELMAIMTGGMATIAGGVMAAYVGMLAAQFPDIAGHLMAASVMSAPAGLVFAKLMLPETGVPETLEGMELDLKQTDQNVIDAAARGASEGMHLVINIVAMLIAFLALVALGNAVWGWGCGLLTRLTGLDLSAINTFQEVAGYLFAPFAWLMGVPKADLLTAGQLLGEKTVLNEFVAYSHLGDILNGRPFAGEILPQLQERTTVILTYALCGFSNFGSIGVLLGGIGGMAPNRRGDLARLGLRALIAGTFASFITANIAGMLI